MPGPFILIVKTCLQRLSIALEDMSPALWTFVAVEAIGPTNNAAEQALLVVPVQDPRAVLDLAARRRVRTGEDPAGVLHEIAGL